MNVVWRQWRAELKAGWRTFALLVLLVGIGGGVALTAVDGARRADTALPRFITYARPATVAVLFGGNPFVPPAVSGPAADSLAAPPYARPVLSLPQVASYFRRPYLFLVSEDAAGSTGTLNTFGSPDTALFTSVDRPHIVAGQLPAPGSPFAVSVNEFAASQLHLHVGSRIRLRSFSARQFAGLTNGLDGKIASPKGPAYTVRVAAIIRLPADVNAIIPLAARQGVTYEGQQNLYLTPAFVRRLARDLHVRVQQLPVMNFFGVRLRHGAADWPAFAAAARKLGGRNIALQRFDPMNSDRAASRTAQRGIHLEVVALLAFGALAGLVTLLMAGQALARQAALQRGEYRTLWSLGATSRQLAGVVLMRAASCSVAGGTLAVTLAALSSPLMPLGLAREAEIHPGFEVNLAIVAPGFLVLNLLLVAGAAVPARRVSRIATIPEGRGDSSARRSRLAGMLARVSAPAATIIGVRFGLEPGRQREAVPVAGTVMGAVAAAAALAASITFGTSLGHLVNTPREQGWNWDVLVGNPNDTVDREAQGGALLARNHLVAGYSAIADLGSVTVSGVRVPTVLAFDPLKGSVLPPLLTGRAPHAPDEIVLGTATLRAVHAHIGQTVRVVTPAGPLTMRVVGTMIVPSVGDVFTNSLGDGGWVSASFLRELASSGSGGPSPAFVLFAVRYAHGTSSAAATASLRGDFGRTVLRQLPAEDAANLQNVAGLPFALAGLVALLALANLGNTLVASVRRRRRDLAVLRAMGFVRYQVASIVAWQSSSLVVVSVIPGLSLGVAVGRWAWVLAASGIGSASPPVVPAAVIAGVIPAAVIAANLMAVWPGRAAACVRPALALRSE